MASIVTSPSANCAPPGYVTTQPDIWSSQTRPNGNGTSETIAYGFKYRRFFGSLLIFCGIFTIGIAATLLGIVIEGPSFAYTFYRSNHVDKFSYGIWCGVVTVVTGVLGIFSKKKCIVVAVLVMSIVTAIFSFSAMGFSIFSSVSLKKDFEYAENNYENNAAINYDTVRYGYYGGNDCFYDLSYSERCCFPSYAKYNRNQCEDNSYFYYSWYHYYFWYGNRQYDIDQNEMDCPYVVEKWNACRDGLRQEFIKTKRQVHVHFACYIVLTIVFFMQGTASIIASSTTCGVLCKREDPMYRVVYCTSANGNQAIQHRHNTFQTVAPSLYPAMVPAYNSSGILFVQNQ